MSLDITLRHIIIFSSLSMNVVSLVIFILMAEGNDAWVYRQMFKGIFAAFVISSIAFIYLKITGH